MTLVFIDTSAVVKLFVQEPGTARMLRMTRGEAGERVALLDLTRVELHSAIHRRERLGDVPAGTARRSRHVLDRYLRSRITVQRSTEPVLERACELVERHALRAYDAVQLAGAIEAGGNEDVIFVTADSELASAAAAEGLRTVDPAREEA